MPDEKKRSRALDFLSSKKQARAQEGMQLFDSSVYQADEGVQDVPIEESRPVSFPAGVPTITPDVDLQTGEPIDFRKPSSIAPTRGLGERLAHIGMQPFRTVQEYSEMAARGENPVASGFRLARAVPEAAFAVPMMIDEALGISKGLKLDVPMRHLGQGIEDIRENVRETLLTPGARMRLRARGINPARADEVIDEFFGVGQHVAAMAAFGAAGKFATKGLVKGVGRFAESKAGRALSKRLSERIDESLVQSAATEASGLATDRPTLSANAPTSIPGFENIIPPSGKTIFAPERGPASVGAIASGNLLPEGRHNIGGFMLHRPQQSFKVSDIVKAGGQRKGKEFIPPLLHDGVTSVIKSSGENVKYDGYSGIMQSIQLTDNVTGSTFNVKFNNFNPNSVNAALAKMRKPYFEDQQARGIPTIEEYVKLQREGRLSEFPRKPVAGGAPAQAPAAAPAIPAPKPALPLKGKRAETLKRLDENGKAAEEVRGVIEKGESKTGPGKDVLTMADWISKVKEKYPDLTARHENELYEHLKKNYKTQGKKYQTPEAFFEFADKTIKKRSTKGKADESLNLERVTPTPTGKGRIVEEYEARINGLTDSWKKAQARITKKYIEYNKQKLSEREIAEKLKADRADRGKYEEDISKEIIKMRDALKAEDRTETNLHKAEKANPTYREVLVEVKRRLDEGGVLFEGGLAAGIPLDATKIAYVLDPIVKKVQSDAMRLIQEGSIAADDAWGWVNRSTMELLQKSQEFRDLPIADKKKMFETMRRRLSNTVYDASTGRFHELAKAQYDQPRREDSGSLKGATEEVPTNPNMPNLRYEEGSPALYKSKNLSHTLWDKTRRQFFVTMGKYVSNQTVFGEHLVESLNFVDRRAGQWAERFLIEYGKLSKKMSDAEFDEFVTFANEGGTSSNPNIAAALDWWRATAKEIITRAKEAGLETTYAEVTKNALGGRDIKVVSRPIGEREFYFPHEYEWAKLMDVDFQKVYIDALAKKEGISFGEAQELFNKYLKHRSEMKYGNLEKPRMSGDNNWSRKRDVIPSYIERSTRRITTAEVMGRKNSIAMEMIDKINNHGGDAWAAKELFDRWLGADYPTNTTGAWLYEMSRKTGSWQVAAKLGLLHLLNPSQINNTALLFGTYRVMRESMRQVGDFAKWREFAKRSAAITDQTIKMHMKEQLSLEGIGGKVMDWTGVKLEERILRGNAAAVAGSILEQFGKRLGEPKVYNETAGILRVLQLDKQIDVAKVKSRGGFTKQELLDIGFEGARATQFLTRPQDMPTFFSMPEARMFNQFKSFAVQQSALVWRVFKELPPAQKARTLATLGINYPISGAIVNSIRDGLKDRDPKEVSELESYVRAMATVGGMGILYDMLTQSSYNQAGWGAYIAGPTVGDVSRLWYGIFNPEYLPETFARQIPIPYLQQIGVVAARPDKSRTARLEKAREKATERSEGRSRVRPEEP
jgi:hypothetical protein